MNRLVTSSLLVLLAVAVAFPTLAADKEKKKRKKDRQPAQVAAVMKKLEAVELTEEQAAKIKDLTAGFTAKLAEAQAKLGDGQQAIAAARKEAAAEGKKGKDLQAAITAKLTEEQLAAWKQVQGLNRELQQAVAAVLTDEQREKAKLRAGKGGEKKKKKSKKADAA